MPRKRILAGKPSSAGTLVRFAPRVDLGMALQIVLPHKALAAVIAPELAIPQMRLHVAADVLAASKRLGVASGVETRPAVVGDVLRGDVLLDLNLANSGVLDGAVDAEVGDGDGAGGARGRVGSVGGDDGGLDVDEAGLGGEHERGVLVGRHVDEAPEGGLPGRVRDGVRGRGVERGGVFHFAGGAGEQRVVLGDERGVEREVGVVELEGHGGDVELVDGHGGPFLGGGHGGGQDVDVDLAHHPVDGLDVLVEVFDLLEGGMQGVELGSRGQRSVGHGPGGKGIGRLHRSMGRHASERRVRTRRQDLEVRRLNRQRGTVELRMELLLIWVLSSRLGQACLRYCRVAILWRSCIAGVSMHTYRKVVLGNGPQRRRQPRRRDQPGLVEAEAASMACHSVAVGALYSGGRRGRWPAQLADVDVGRRVLSAVRASSRLDCRSRVGQHLGNASRVRIGGLSSGF
jgi:hypothetical protein